MSYSKTFYLDFKSEESGKTYTGTFAIKRFSIKDRGAIAVRKVQLNQGLHFEGHGMGVDEDTDNLHYMLACLELGVTTAPPWFKLDELYEVDLVGHLFREVSSFQDTFRTNRPASTIEPGTVSNGAEGSRPPAQGAERSGTSPKVVEWEVQASLEP